ncbi:hypothetical protein [Thalassotalea sp. PS06]|uniref:hypothetical protein n=1 Tax=Thalassotalea sp. PS06 TaxID=2594005 RepID=UPI001164FFF5|nr:hypothetical protein [Thalassotalea sp. PS06]QDP00233.1 hypothetical protein FNC98_02020 [Thalassotalea sp. PS06]
MKLDKRLFKNPGDAFKSLINESEWYSDKNIPAENLRIGFKANVKMDRKNGFRIGHQKFATNSDVFFKLGATNSVKSIVIEVYFDPYDCRNVSCIAYDQKEHPIEFETHNVVYKYSEHPISFDDAIPYQTAYQNKLAYHEPSTEGKHVKKDKQDHSRDKTTSVNLENDTFIPADTIKNGGKKPSKQIKNKKANKDLLKSGTSQTGRTLIRKKNYGEIDNND